MRRQFGIAEEDEACLRERGIAWEAVIEGGNRWLILCAYPIPAGYNMRSATVALLIPATYPDTQIDMVYVNPPLALASGGRIGALAQCSIDNNPFQRWSRHRTGVNPWMPGIDSIGTHLILVDSWFERELGK